jgi:hypothetical protein
VNDIDWGAKTLSVRINGLDTEFWHHDVVDLIEKSGDQCKHRGEVSTSPARAQASWNLVNDADLPRHGCKAAPAPRFRQRDGLWGAYCSCGFDDAGYHSLEGARAGWARSLR